MEELIKTTNKLIALAAKTSKKPKQVVRKLMTTWIMNITSDNLIHHEDFGRYSRKAINFLALPNYHITKSEDKWFVEDIIRAAYSYIIGDKEAVDEWIDETNKAYETWESKIEVDIDTKDN